MYRNRCYTLCIRNKRSIGGLPAEKQAQLLAPYLQTERLVYEMVNLKVEINRGYIKLKEASYSSRKDRYMALAYGNYYANELEKSLGVSVDDDIWGSLWN